VTVFVDTSALYALLDAGDLAHPRAARGHERLHGEAMVTHAFVAVETISLVRRRLGVRAAERVIDELLPLVDIDEVDRSLREEVTRTYRASVSSAVSFVDQVSFAFMRQRGLTRAWAIDQDFETAGFELVA
jgi:uncharacterized protein